MTRLAVLAFLECFVLPLLALLAVVLWLEYDNPGLAAACAACGVVASVVVASLIR
jgi:hypothetical protein